MQKFAPSPHESENTIVYLVNLLGLRFKEIKECLRIFIFEDEPTIATEPDIQGERLLNELYQEYVQ